MRSKRGIQVDGGGRIWAEDDDEHEEEEEGRTGGRSQLIEPPE